MIIYAAMLNIFLRDAKMQNLNHSYASRISGYLRLTVITLCLVAGFTMQGQMMPVEDKAKTAAKVEQKIPDSNQKSNSIYEKYFSENSQFRPIILALLTLAVLLALKKYTSGLMKKSLEQRAFYQENVTTFMGFWNKLWKFVIAVLVLIALSGSFRVIGFDRRLPRYDAGLVAAAAGYGNRRLVDDRFEKTIQG